MKRPKAEGGKATTRSGETRDQATKKPLPDAPRKKKTPSLPPSSAEDNEPERLNKVLARSGVASRRAVDEMIRKGQVKLNGEVVTELGTKVNPAEDRVTVAGKRVALVPRSHQVKVYFLLNKPAGVLTTVKDDRDRKTVMDLVAGASESRIYPVGRLDYDAEGALLLTNDGELAATLMSPRKALPKVYRVKVKGEPAEDKLDILRRGIRLEDGPTKPCQIDVISKARVNTWLEVVLTEGKNRQLKRMFWRIRHPVLKIHRIAFAGLELGRLPPGQYRELTRAELEKLKRAVA
ncbi:MAG: pseudouridine synthase [Myxococcota bacterium]